MTDMTSPPTQLSRRDALRWTFGLTVGSTVAGLTACGGDDPGMRDSLPQPNVLTSANGRLELELNLRYGRQSLTLSADTGNQPASYPAATKTVMTDLRAYEGRYMAPTLVVNAGDVLRIRLNNQLPPNPTNPTTIADLSYQNSTNLHFHGLHVDPKEIRPGVYGDYVVDSWDAGVRPGASRLHEIHIPKDHPSGVHWYHPHLHGATNSQVSSGMFGAILIRSADDRFLAPGQFKERIVHVHKLTLNPAGRIDSFDDAEDANASAFVLNGVYQPTLVMRPGEVQVWHFINVTTFYPFNPTLDQHTMQSFARDGNVFDKKFVPVDSSTAGLTLASGEINAQHWPGNALYPGGRLSVLIKANDVPGTYFLRAGKAPSGQYDDEIVARVLVEGPAADMAMPRPSGLPSFATYQPITEEEVARAGGKHRNLLLAALQKDDPHIAKPIPAGEGWFIPDPNPQNEFVFGVGQFGGPMGLSPFQSSLTPTQTVPLNAVEEWTIHSLNNYPHPFHIHINDMYVVKINDEPVTPFWCDTLPVPSHGSFTFRMRFTDFTGKFVWHCHALDHEDMGMMQLVDVV